MASVTYHIDTQGLDALDTKMKQFGEGAGQVVSNAIKNKVGPLIANKIDPLIPVSGRTFKGHSTPARGSAWKKYDASGSPMSITVTTVPRRSYLYFPDDGETTRRHIGAQNFFGRGAEAAQDEIVELLTGELEKEWEK